MKETTVYLHIGRHKTGTTTIQSILSSNYDILLENGVLYPKTGREDYQKINHHGLFGDTTKIKKKDISIDIEIVRKLRLEILSSNCETVIISSEVFSRPLINFDSIRLLSEILGFKIKLIVYLRKQSTFLLSSYAERIKQGIVQKYEQPLDINLELDYLEFLNSFEEIFGADNITIFIFEDNNGSQLFKNFISEINIDLYKKCKIDSTKFNEKLCWSYLYFLGSIKNPYLKRMFSNSYVRTLLNKFFIVLFKNEAPISKEKMDEIDECYRISNSFLIEKYKVIGGTSWNIK